MGLITLVCDFLYRLKDTENSCSFSFEANQTKFLKLELPTTLFEPSIFYCELIQSSL